MNQQRVLIAGVVLLLLSCITSLYLALRIANARIEGVFATVASDSPLNRFKHLRCPLLLNKSEAASVVVAISNPTSDDLDYLVQIETYGLNIRSPDEELEVTIPGGHTTEVAWVVTAVEDGNQAISVQALSSADLALPGPFHTWPTSFREGCGILVLDWPLTGKQILLLSLAGVLVGAVLSFPQLYAIMRERIKRKQPD